MAQKSDNIIRDITIFEAELNSPVGLLKIRSDLHSIHSVLFADNAMKTIPVFPPENLPLCIHQCMNQLTEYFNGERQQFELPMQPKGTPFQLRVWTQLQAIPYGRTISYAELAKRLGDPKTIRAAGTANGRNPLGIIIPCHRVIGSSGQLVGYAGGLWRKKWLMDHENKIANGVLPLFS